MAQISARNEGFLADTSYQDGTEESAERSQHRQAPRVLSHREGRCKRDQHEHDAQPYPGANHGVQVDRREGGEIHDAGAATLEGKGVLPPRVPQSSEIPSFCHIK